MNPFKAFFNIGVRPEHDISDARFIRAVNVLGGNAIVSVIGVSLYGYFVQQNPTGFYPLFILPFFLGVIYLNHAQKTMLAVSILFIASAAILGIYSIRTGEKSYTHTLYVLNIIGLSLLYRKEKTRKYFYVSMIATVISIVVVLLSFQFNWFIELRDPLVHPDHERRLIFFLLIVCSILFSMVVVVSYNQQHRAMENSLEEQRVLLAEVNHRVKNNMAVIISLINLQRNNAKNEETQYALRDIHDRIMAMALVHQRMYENKSKSAIEIGGYINELINELRKSLDIKDNIEFTITSDQIFLDVSQTIPLGLILNELVTNSIKHAFEFTAKPTIDISVKKLDAGTLELIVHDNGKGIDEQEIKANGGLGLSLIQSLSEQIEGKCTFKKENGFIFRLSFPLFKIG